MVVVGTYELLNEVCDEKKFYKTLSGPLVEARSGLLDGLFTVRGF